MFTQSCPFLLSVFLTLTNSKYYPEHSLVLLLIAGFLLVDSAVGIIQKYIGVHIPISMIYKTPVLLLLLLIIALRDPKFTAWILAALLCFIIGPVIQLLTFNDPSALFYDITLALKILSPILYLRYFMIAADEIPELFSRAAPRILILSCAIFAANMLAGLFGLGYPSYTTGGKDIGINGFFIAGNEMGAVYVILSAFLLTKAFHYSFKRYCFAAVVTIIIGVLIATKASMLASFILVLFLPIFISGKKALRPTTAKVVICTLVLLIMGIIISAFIDVLKNAGFWTRLVWIYEEHGILRLILSSRDEFATALFAIFSEHGKWYNWLFGMSSASAKHYWLATKLVAEVDPIDAVIIFGFIGLGAALVIQFYLLRHVLHWYQLQRSQLAPACLLSFLLLQALAFTSGHIWLSGMMGPFLGLMFGICYFGSRDSDSNLLSVSTQK